MSLSEILKTIFYAALIVLPIRIFLFQPFTVQGVSMEPNFHDGEYLIVNEWGYKETDLNLGDRNIFSVKPFKELIRGDVVVFRYPYNQKIYFIKRIIGLPGERVVIQNGQIKIYNQENPQGLTLNEEKYLPGLSRSTDFKKSEEDIAVKEGITKSLAIVKEKKISNANSERGYDFNLGEKEYLVLGDNRNHSSDSRVWGKLNSKLVIGKVVLRILPPRAFAYFE